MQVRKQNNELNKWLQEEMWKLFEQFYAKQLSESIKRGIKTKRLQKRL